MPAERPMTDQERIARLIEELDRLKAALADLIQRVDAVGNWGPLSPVTDHHRALAGGGE